MKQHILCACCRAWPRCAEGAAWLSPPRWPSTAPGRYSHTAWTHPPPELHDKQCIACCIVADARSKHGLAVRQAVGRSLCWACEGGWGLQGLPALGLDEAQFAAVLAAVGDTAAFGSTVAGELAASSREAAADLLAGAGFLGRVLSLPEVRAHDIMPCDMHQVFFLICLFLTMMFSTLLPLL